jgi:hypothetical protein
MRSADLSEATLNAFISAESSVDHLANSWRPPIAPTESSHDDDSFLGEQAFGATSWDEHPFQPTQQSDLHQILTSFASDEGDWVQVESDYLNGWIKSKFLGPNDAR